MKFMITFNHVDGGWQQLTPVQQASHNEALVSFVKALEEEKGAKLVFLDHPSAGKTVRLDTGGRHEVLDGARPPAPDYAGGYYVIEADSLEEAVEWARRGRFMPGTNEVRQILDFDPAG